MDDENFRILRIKKIDSIDSLKAQILDGLRINNHKRDCLNEFEARLSNYFDRNSKLNICLEVSLTKVSETFRKRIEIELTRMSIPDNYEFGNPLNRWIFEPVIKTQQEIELEKEQIDKKLESEMMEFKGMIEMLKRFFRIKILE